jgi:septal ring factor EnvC (AmiA/AmiB activator)
MKRLLTTLLVLISLGLCVVCVVQWQREDRYRGHIADLVKRLEAENRAKVEALRKVREYEKEIARLTEIRAEVEAKLVEVTRDYNDLSRTPSPAASPSPFTCAS